MSLTVAPPPTPQFSYGIICSASFDASALLSELFLGHIDSVGHIYTNDATDLVYKFACANGIAITTFPLHGGRSLPWTLSRIIEASDAVYIIADEESKSAGMAAVQCEKRAKKDEKFKWKLVPFEPVTYWREKVCRVAEIVEAMPPEDVKGNVALAAVAKAVK